MKFLSRLSCLGLIALVLLAVGVIGGAFLFGYFTPLQEGLRLTLVGDDQPADVWTVEEVYNKVEICAAVGAVQEWQLQAMGLETRFRQTAVETQICGAKKSPGTSFKLYLAYKVNLFGADRVFTLLDREYPLPQAGATWHLSNPLLGGILKITHGNYTIQRMVRLSNWGNDNYGGRGREYVDVEVVSQRQFERLAEIDEILNPIFDPTYREQLGHSVMTEWDWMGEHVDDGRLIIEVESY